MEENINSGVQTEVVDADAIMQEFDRESNTRIFTGWRKKVITTLFVAFSTYMIAMALLFPTATKYTKLTTFMAFIVFMGYLIFPAYKKQTKKINYVPFYDIILAIVGGGSFLYYTIFQDDIVKMGKRIGTIQIVFAILAILLLAELVRRAVGIPILCVAGGFIVYATVKQLLQNPSLTLRNLAYSLFYDISNGLFSTPVYVCTTFIVLFIILGALLEKTGIGTFFVDLANSVCGSACGGPAKVAVVSSALEGMYSGSSVANTVGSGSITIPMMKKTGYKPEFAAAVEASASTGGQIMPPIMGAAAFLMAEMTGYSYAKIAISAILPAFLYFAGIFLMIHFEAKKLGLKGLPKDSLPSFFKLIARNGYLLIPVVILVICMNFFSAGVSACFAILACFIVSLVPHKIEKDAIWRMFLPLIPIAVTLVLWLVFDKMQIGVFVGMVVCAALSFVAKGHAPLDPETVIGSLENGAKNTIGVATACGMAGLISGVVTMTALGQLLINVLVPVAQKSMFLALFLTMICCIVLGMGVPTTANYVIMATITAPILIKMGIPILAAHMFVFYFGIVADITPPVALAAYAGAAIAKSNPLKTGVEATRLAITAFIIPYIFAFSPEMLIIDSDAKWYSIVLLVITAIIGCVAVSAGMEGYLLKKMNVLERILALGGGLCVIIPGWQTDAVGIVILAVLFAIQYLGNKKKHEVA